MFGESSAVSNYNCLFDYYDYRSRSCSFWISYFDLSFFIDAYDTSFFLYPLAYFKRRHILEVMIRYHRS